VGMGMGGGGGLQIRASMTGNEKIHNPAGKIHL